jgi:hypothetical protein
VKRDPEARKALAEQALELYTSGKTLEDVARRLEVSYGKAHALVKEAGGTLRRRGGPKRS